MEEKEKQTGGAARVQVFELTMDNSEDQDDLNRQLHKLDEPSNSPNATIGRKVQSDSTESAENKSGGRRNSSRSNG